jgi:hypothetical protein
LIGYPARQDSKARRRSCPGGHTRKVEAVISSASRLTTFPHLDLVDGAPFDAPEIPVIYTALD